MHNNYAYGSLAPYIDLSDVAIPVDLNAAFSRNAPLDVEIGFGTGEYITGLAQKEPTVNFIGFENCAKRILKTLRKVHEAGLTNVRIFQLDASLGFRHVLSPQSVRQVHCLFPCPWPKKRHAKHRLFSTDFLQLVNSRLVAGGCLRLVTDQRPYADWIMECLPGTGFAVERRVIPPSFGTKFEKKWLESGQQTFDELLFVKTAHVHWQEEGARTMTIYYIDKIDPKIVKFEGLTGPVSVQFKDFIFDPVLNKGMLLAIVVEDRRTQYLWMMIDRTTKGWCLSAAPGSSALPTGGVQKALELAHAAFQRSGKES